MNMRIAGLHSIGSGTAEAGCRYVVKKTPRFKQLYRRLSRNRWHGNEANALNASAVRLETLEFIVDAQLRQVLRESFDNFKKLTFDFTKVEANSTFSTDSGLMKGLLEPAEHMLHLLAKHGR